MTVKCLLCLLGKTVKILEEIFRKSVKKNKVGRLEEKAKEEIENTYIISLYLREAARRIYIYIPRVLYSR